MSAIARSVSNSPVASSDAFSDSTTGAPAPRSIDLVARGFVEDRFGSGGVLQLLERGRSCTGPAPWRSPANIGWPFHVSFNAETTLEKERSSSVAMPRPSLALIASRMDCASEPAASATWPSAAPCTPKRACSWLITEPRASAVDFKLCALSKRLDAPPNPCRSLALAARRDLRLQAAEFAGDAAHVRLRLRREP